MKKLKDRFGTSVGAGNVILRPTGQTTIDIGIVIETTPKSLRYIKLSTSAAVSSDSWSHRPKLKSGLILTQYKPRYNPAHYCNGPTLIASEYSLVMDTELMYDGMHEQIQEAEFHRYFVQINDIFLECYADKQIHDAIQEALNA